MRLQAWVRGNQTRKRVGDQLASNTKNIYKVSISGAKTKEKEELVNALSIAQKGSTKVETRQIVAFKNGATYSGQWLGSKK